MAKERTDTEITIVGDGPVVTEARRRVEMMVAVAVAVAKADRLGSRGRPE